MNPEQKSHMGTPLNESESVHDAAPLRSENNSVAPSDIPGTLDSRRAGWSPVVGGEQNQSGGSGIRGVVRGFEMRTEETPSRMNKVSVWTFRVERYDPKASATLPPVQVVMLATPFDSGIHDGDEVEVFGKLEAGRPIKATRVNNITTGTTVKAKTANFGATLLIALLLWGATFFFAVIARANAPLLLIALIAGIGAFGATIFVLNKLVDKVRLR